jgi:glycosyltransferase involved in cell wall biosynthesis
MFSVVIATQDSERTLVPTLAALVPGATAGLVRDVIVADGGSKDETEQVAEIAGCRFLASAEPLGARLAAAAREARGPWLMFLTAGTVPEPTWIDETMRFAEASELRGEPRAAVFSPARAGGFGALVRRLTGALPEPGQGLMISKLLYEELGGHRAAAAEPRNDLLRRIGRRRLVTLRSAALQAPD